MRIIVIGTGEPPCREVLEHFERMNRNVTIAFAAFSEAITTLNHHLEKEFIPSAVVAFQKIADDLAKAEAKAIIPRTREERMKPNQPFYMGVPKRRKR